jgi:polysaccharide export outer membrane protein
MLLVLCLAFFLSPIWEPAFGQAKVETPEQTNDKIVQLAALANTKPGNIPIGSGDLLHIDVFDAPELSRDVRVNDTGFISYPLLPEKIEVAGLTSFQIEDKLQQLLVENGIISHPQVSVFVKEQNSQPVSIVGAVMRPMVYQVMRPTTLLEILAVAGGITDDAGSVVIITRANHAAEKSEPSLVNTSASEDQQTITIRLQDLLESGSAVYNIPVLGGDVVSVPHGGIVYVLGEGVAQPGGYVLQGHGEQVTVLKALALAHGLSSFAKANAAVILRTNPTTGQKDEIPVHIKEIENRKTNDVPLKSNDVLYVPSSTGKKVVARGAEAAIGIGTSVAIYRSY